MAKIIGNPTTTPMAISDWNQNIPTKASHIKNKPTKLSEFINDIDSIPSIVYTELDNFTDGVCKVTSKSPDEPLCFDDVSGEIIGQGSVYVESETFALCIANAKYFDESEQYRSIVQILILPGKGIYNRYKSKDYISGEWIENEWSKWQPFRVSEATKAIFDDTGARFSSKYATKEEVPKWKTLLDVTLIEEQSGVSELLLAIEDVESFVNARQIRIAMSFPVAEAKSANTFSTTIRISNKDKKRYNQTVLSGQNSNGSANSIFFTTAQIDMFNFVYNSNFTKSYHSLMQLPTPHYNASANTVKAPMECNGGFYIPNLINYPPYLNIFFGGTTPPVFEAGTHIFMEVCE